MQMAWEHSKPAGKGTGDNFCGSPLPSFRECFLILLQPGRAAGARGRLAGAAAVQPPGSAFLFLSCFTSHEGEPPVTRSSPLISLLYACLDQQRNYKLGFE